MAANFAALREQLIRLIDLASTIPVEERSYSASELIDLAAEPLAAKLADPHYSIGFAAYEVGQAIVSLAGFEALHRMFDEVEQVAGDEPAEWLSRQWTGLSDEQGRTWSD